MRCDIPSNTSMLSVAMLGCYSFERLAPLRVRPFFADDTTGFCALKTYQVIIQLVAPSDQMCSPSRNGLILPQYDMCGICHYMLHYLPLYVTLFAIICYIICHYMLHYLPLYVTLFAIICYIICDRSIDLQYQLINPSAGYTCRPPLIGRKVVRKVT